MLRRRNAPWLLALAILTACGTADQTTGIRADARRASADVHAPGAIGGPPLGTGAIGRLAGCTPRDPQYGTATIGPSGGELDVGASRLIIPPGALTRTVQVSGTVTADSTLRIDLQPTGLQFKKSAGLILDASNCLAVPDVVYINELGVASPPILAIYSTWWRTIAAPIDHFSGYAVAFEE